MNETLSLVLVLVAGMSLGGLFFGGLWWTVRKGIAARRPAHWFLLSMLTRMGVVLTGFFVIAREDRQRWLLCLLGLILARAVVKHGARSRQVSYAS